MDKQKFLHIQVWKDKNQTKSDVFLEGKNKTKHAVLKPSFHCRRSTFSPRKSRFFWDTFKPVLVPSSTAPAIWEISQREFHFFPSTNTITSINNEQSYPHLSPTLTRTQRTLSFIMFAAVLITYDTHKINFNGDLQSATLILLIFFCFGAFIKTFINLAVNCIIYVPCSIITLSQIYPQASESWSNSVSQTLSNPHV